MKQVKPDYKNSIVNVTNSILDLDGPKLKELKNLKKKRILLIIDGMGYNFLLKNSSLKPSAKITSVFPSTTATAITSLNTGLEPAEHSVSGWYVFFKELGAIVAPLPAFFRYSRTPISDNLEFKRNILPLPKFANRVLTKKIVGFDKKISTRSEKLYSYDNIEGLTKQTRKAIKKHDVVYSYYPFLDEIEHVFGPDSVEAKQEMEKVEKSISFLADRLPNDTSLIITADHGQMQTTKEKMIFLQEHKKLRDIMTMPLTGEPRAAYAFIKNGMEKDFCQYIKKNFSKKIGLFHSEEFIKKGHFGTHKVSQQLRDRIGDFILLPKENYVIRDTVFNEIPKMHLGNHGGLSEDEMLVPLIRIDR